MTGGNAGDGGWLRPLGLLLLAVTLAVGQPIVVVAVAFGMLSFVVPGGGALALVASAIALVLVFLGEPASGLWYIERGWAIVLGGWFAALTLTWPGRPFLLRGLVALGGGVLSVVAVVTVFDGWERIEALVAQRVEAGLAATRQVMQGMGNGDIQAGLMETLATTGEIQGLLFPALLGLSSLAALGVAWWLHVRVNASEGPALGPLKEFRFPDPLIWLFIAGITLVLVAGWSVGWGRVGVNLVAFMGALYVLRGAAVLLFFAGGLSFAGGALAALAVLLLGPFLAAAAMLVGVGDSWLDLRARTPDGGNGST
ncbi:MAG: DUF2232 domain-containing protein [Gemmatimonadota bacterium]